MGPSEITIRFIPELGERVMALEIEPTCQQELLRQLGELIIEHQNTIDALQRRGERLEARRSSPGSQPEAARESP